MIALTIEEENILNFTEVGKAKWIIRKKTDSEHETIFDVSFGNKEYTCLGVNRLKWLPKLHDYFHGTCPLFARSLFHQLIS